MKNIIFLFIILALYSSVLSSKVCASWVIPKEQWTPQAKLWLSRGMVAEAGWTANRDHAAIAFVLARRWKNAVTRYQNLKFLDVIRRYCSALDFKMRSISGRQIWLRTLGFDLQKPIGWPEKKVSWENHKIRWKKILTMSELWVHNKIIDPCGGKAWHWGSPEDLPKGKMTRIDCGKTLNVFYGLKGVQWKKIVNIE